MHGEDNNSSIIQADLSEIVGENKNNVNSQDKGEPGALINNYYDDASDELSILKEIMT